ncbi:UPF0179 family protein [Methanocaldococcus indicus]|uniref:UPF0179 family protein n=1 Tax=Methanocaldococcus indicus TaxID=213231 RepID=UPI003C6CCF20
MITLIGSKLAKTGEEFLYVGELDECEKCRFKKLCHGNLEKGRIYKIVSVRSSNHPCPIFDEGVKVVEVKLANLTIMVDAKKALEGMTLHFEPIKCDNYECPYYKYCSPSGIYEGEKFEIIKVFNEKINCKNNRTLKKVLIELKL